MIELKKKTIVNLTNYENDPNFDDFETFYSNCDNCPGDRDTYYFGDK